MKSEIEHTSTMLGSQNMKSSQRMVSVVEPYELPEGWKWCRLGEVCKTFSDGDWIESKDQSTEGIRLIQTGNIGKGAFRDKNDKCRYISENTFERLNCTEVFAGDILISRLPEPVGRACIIPQLKDRMITAVDCAIVRLFEGAVEKKWFCFYTQSHVYDGFVKTSCTGTTRLRISRKNLGEIPFPLPPTLAEQQRIVNRIESMFAKLDEAKDKAQNVVDGFETRKAAILHKAFTGELTAKWRKEKGVPDDSWEEKTIGEICLVKGGKRVPKGMSLIKEKNEHPYLKAGNLKFGTVVDKDMEYVPNDVFILIKNYTVNAGDVYITNVGACIGDCGIIPDYYHGANLTENAVKLTEMICNNSYLATQLSSNLVQTQIKSKIKSATLGKLSIDNIKQLKINLPTLTEQVEIVRILDIIIEKENKAKQAAEVVLEQIDLLKKSILARAFRGEL